jgi:ribonucleotide reductase alpha subunit
LALQGKEYIFESKINLELPLTETEKENKSKFSPEQIKAEIDYIQSNLDNYFNQEFYKYVMDNREELNKIINSRLDYNFTYFGYKTLERAYLTKVNNIIIETPQDMWLRVAIAIHYKSNNIEFQR